MTKRIGPVQLMVTKYNVGQSQGVFQNILPRETACPAYFVIQIGQVRLHFSFGR